MASATGFSSTATDLVRYAAAHFHGDDRLLSDDAQRQMQRTEWAVEGTTTSYGLGLSIAEIGDRRVLGHGGGFPGFITRTWFDPVDRLAVAVLTNAIDGPALTLANAAVRLVDLANRPPPGRPRRSAPASTWRRSAAGSPTSGASSTSSPSAGGCPAGSHGSTILPPSRSTSPSSTSARCASPRPPGTPRPVSVWSTTAPTTARCAPCAVAAGRRRIRWTPSPLRSPAVDGSRSALRSDPDGAARRAFPAGATGQDGRMAGRTTP